ncbi:hypothetical protein ACJMK2_008016 [Sinanodonta woodiana]|uniref:Major facilitator superfamily (MFS) profile domain-containing protein n=1 Tax=Sinanodonta woodiana TaxID=1069815 RepID=A0ABD3VK90_SINWO
MKDTSESDALLVAKCSVNCEVDHVDVIMKTEKKRKFTANLALAIFACILGSSFQFGYNTGVVNAPAKVIKSFYNETCQNRTGVSMSDSTLTLLWAITVSIFAVGGMFGGVSAGYWANRFGRRGALLRNNLLTTIGALVMFSSKYAKSYEMLILGRFIIGLSAGIGTGIAPLYLSEIAPVSLRGMCGTFNQLAVCFGVLTSQVFGLDAVLGSPNSWQFDVGFSVIPVVLQLCSLSFCPESPRYLLITKDLEDEADKALQWLRKTIDVSDEIEEMISEKEAQSRIKKFTFGDLLTSASLRTPLTISIVMQLSQQFSGINAVIYYSTSIFESAGLSGILAKDATVVTGGVNVLMTFVSALIMDRAGRRSLHLIGLGGMFIAGVILVIGLIFQNEVSWLKYICIIAVLVYVIFFAAGPGSIPWFFVAELFAQGPRSAAVSVAVLVNWFANFIVGLVFPILQSTIGQYSFIPFVVLLAVFWLYTILKVPETKGMTIEEITASFRNTPVAYQSISADRSVR